MTLGLSAVGLAACGDDSTTNNASSAAAKKSERIVIKTSAQLIEAVDTGKILAGSTIGGAPFCPGGTWNGGHGVLANNWLDKNIKCPDGTVRLEFNPRPSTKTTDIGPWKVLSATGAYKGMRGSGQMKIKYPPGDMPTTGHETFTGTITR